jgi:hypothetical protein
MPTPPPELVDSVTVAGGAAGACQSLLADAVAAPATAAQLAALGAAYLRFLGALPGVALAPAPWGVAVGLWPAPARLPLLRLGRPYLAAARGGRELRHPILGGLMARRPGGHLALGAAPERGRARLWVEVAGYHPRLGLGPLYLLTQVQVHRLVCAAFLRRAARALAG